MSHYGQVSALKERVANTVYIGGGTPTLVSQELPLMIKNLRNQFQLDTFAEISLEAHPAGIQTEDLIPLLRAGFNRISLGIQSFHDSDLVYLNRGHTVQEAYEAFYHARHAGFKNISIDLIYGLPGQTISQWKDNIFSAVKLSPEHLSVYGLTLDDRTYFDYLKKQGKLEETEDELQAEMYLFARRELEKEGFIQYEVSNFAKPGFESQHNLYYWTQGDFLGLGAMAASFLKGVHSMNEKTVEGYIRKITAFGSAVEQSERLDLESQFKEALVFGLRKNTGVKLSELNPEYFSFIGSSLPKLLALCHEGFLKQVQEEHFILSEKGLLFSDHVSMTLI